MGYDQYTVPNDCSCRTYFDCFPLALANICPWPLVPFFPISLENRADKTTHITFRDCLGTFSDNLSQNSCIWRKTVMHINKREDSGRHQRGLISSFYDYCPFSKKFVSHNSRQKKEDKVGHKTVHKKERQRKKESAREIHSEKIFKFSLVGMREKQKRLFIYFQVVGKYAFCVALLC